MAAEDKLTDEQVNDMLKRLAVHFGEPVQPLSRYCAALETWARCIGERALRLEKELLPNLHDWTENHERTAQAASQRDLYERVKARSALRGLIPSGLAVLRGFLSETTRAEILEWAMNSPTSREEEALSQLADFEESAHQVERTSLAIHKSNLLARLLYSGEKLRTVMCPEHKGIWSGIEWSDTVCPHRCQLTGWVQEEDDRGKPLPGVQAVMLIPTGEKPGEVTMIRDVDGTVLGKATMQEGPKPKP